MTAPSTIELGPVSERKPIMALCLSLFLPGLGQVYCGVLRCGLLQLSIAVLLIVTAIIMLSSQRVNPLMLELVIMSLSVILSLYSAWDARRLALSCREDYRLKEYNRPSVYIVLVFLMMGLMTGFSYSIRENFLSVYYVPSSSMSPTIESGDKVLVRKDSYRDREPARNDLVVFLNPGDRRQTWVKRVIGLPGDTLEMRGGVTYINGEKHEELPTIATDKADVEAITIPEYHCYVLGDHRANSRDSRHIGPVPMIALVGKVIGED